MNEQKEPTLNECLTGCHDLYDFMSVVVVLSAGTNQKILCAYATTFTEPNGCLFDLGNKLRVRNPRMRHDHGILCLYFDTAMDESKVIAEAILAAMDEDPRYADPWLRSSLKLEEQ